MARLLLSLVLAVTATFASAAEPVRIRVLSYNIHHGEGMDRKLDLNRIADVINSVSPDAVALQEVDRTTQRSAGIDQAAELARLTTMHVVFEKNIAFQGGQYGNAVLSRRTVIKHQNVHLPSVNQGEQRGVLVCDLELREAPAAKGGAKPSFVFLCTHLDHRGDDRERLASAHRINQLIQERGDTPAILAGDLNAVMDSAVLATFVEQWQLANQNPLPTIPVGQPTRQIDFILFRPAHRWRTIDIRVLEEAIASDHRAIFAELEYLPER